MERQFCINWPMLIEEAKQRRKKQRLTQARLAEIAGVSTPTISHFESGEKDIQLSTVIRILRVLGMNDPRNLVFTRHDEHYDPGKTTVLFSGKDGKKIIQCAISAEALEDYFQGTEKTFVKVFQANRDIIEHKARRKYLAGDIKTQDTILLKSIDFE